MCGFGLAVIIATLGQPSFYTSMDLVADPTAPGYGQTNDFLATIQGVFFAGGFFGCLFTGLTGSKLGRLWSFRVAAAVGILGSGIQAGAVNQGMVGFLARRLALEDSDYVFSILLRERSLVSQPDRHSSLCRSILQRLARRIRVVL
jgi:hypothetical protein